MLQILSSAILNIKSGTVEADRTVDYKEQKKRLFIKKSFKEKH